MKSTRLPAITGGFIATLLVAGCVLMPTEKMGVSDLRPQISFTAENASALFGRVFVDGLDVGSVADFTAGQATLRILPGNHRVRIVAGNALLLDESVYLGDGVNRTFLLK